MLIFKVKKKQEVKKLQTLAAETISDLVSQKEDFEHLEIPKQLLSDLNEAYDDIIWRGNMKCLKCKGKLSNTDFLQCPSNIKHTFCYSCCRKYITKHESGSVAPCLSAGEKCPLQNRDYLDLNLFF